MQQETKIFVGLNTTEAEYVPLSVQNSMDSQEFGRLTWSWDGSYDDNQGLFINLLENPMFLDGSKHVKMK